MKEKFKLMAEFEEFRQGGKTGLAKLPFSAGPPNNDFQGWMLLEATLLPERGPWFAPALDFRLTVADQPSGVGRNIGLDNSVCEYSAEYIDKGNSESIHLFPLDHIGDANLGVINTVKKPFPDWLTDGDSYYVTIELELPDAKKAENYSEDEIQRQCEEFEQKIDEYRS